MNEDFKSRSPMKWVFLIFLVLCLSGVVAISILRDKIVNNNQNQVTVNGRGSVSYQPDIANVVLGVQIDRMENSEEALKVLNEKVGKIITNLTLLGVDAKNIKNQAYALQPIFDHIDGANILVAYNANQQIIIKVEGMDNNFSLLNQVISESVKAGANQVLGVSFESSKMEELKQGARLLAIEDAKLKSSTLANAIGISLGEKVGWWENVINPSPYYDYSYLGTGGGGPIINSGVHEVVVELGINYKIKNAYR
jgi:uncharacterized protein YggE